MLAMTDAAAGYLTKMLEESHAPRGAAIRIVEEGGGLKPRVDQPRVGDQSFNYSGKRVLLLDPEISKALETCMLDVEETERGPKLILLD